MPLRSLISSTRRFAHRSSFRFALFALAALTLASTALGAQATGRIEGTITDSIHAAPLANANVLAVRIEPEPSVSSGAATDARGHYRIDSLPAGRYMVEFASPLLDSLEITLPPREVSVVEGRATRADFALPSGQTLRLAACPGLTLDKETGAVVGRLSDADTDQPLAGAKVVVAWQDVSVDRKTLTPSVVERMGAVDADSLGRYRLCGVPTGSWLTIQVQSDGRSGSAIRLQVPDSAGVVVRHLSLSTSAARPIAESNAVAADTAPPPLLTGTASVSGVVRGVGGLPLSGAQVRVVGARGTALSDERGRFELRDLPSGTQVLEVKRIGYLLAQQPVELRATRPVSQDVRLQRIVTLDSIRVLAQRSRYPEFEQHRRMNGFGTFFTQDEVARRASFETSDLFRSLPGFRVVGYGLDAKVYNGRGVTSVSGGTCSPNIVIDGMPNQEINLIHPNSIGAIEIYRAGQPVPVQYDRGCGAIVIWSK